MSENQPLHDVKAQNQPQKSWIKKLTNWFAAKLQSAAARSVGNDCVKFKVECEQIFGIGRGMACPIDILFEHGGFRRQKFARPPRR